MSAVNTIKLDYSPVYVGTYTEDKNLHIWFYRDTMGRITWSDKDGIAIPKNSFQSHTRRIHLSINYIKELEDALKFPHLTTQQRDDQVAIFLKSVFYMKYRPNWVMGKSFHNPNGQVSGNAVNNKKQKLGKTRADSSSDNEETRNANTDGMSERIVIDLELPSKERSELIEQLKSLVNKNKAIDESMNSIAAYKAEKETEEKQLNDKSAKVQQECEDLESVIRSFLSHCP